MAVFGCWALAMVLAKEKPWNLLAEGGRGFLEREFQAHGFVEGVAGKGFVDKEVEFDFFVQKVRDRLGQTR